jgi:hypothetical protein
MKLEDLEAKLGIANMGEEEKLALVKSIQANIPALKAEQRVLEAKTQANLVVEAIKKIKEGLEARFDELNGIVDVKVRDITSGKDGIDGKDGKNGVDGRDGKDGLSITGPKGADGEAGQDGVGVQDAHIDFDGSLIITLTDGREINVGEVVPMDVAEKIKIIGNGGGTSQSVLDAIAAVQATIATYGTMATQNANNVAITGGTIDNTVIGGTTPAAGTFTTLTATGQTSLGGAAGSESLRVLTPASVGSFLQVQGVSTGVVLRATGDTGTNSSFTSVTRGTLGHIFSTGGTTTNSQLQVSHTASAVNYVQVTGAATGSAPTISAQGSDTNAGLTLNSKGTGTLLFQTSGVTRASISSGATFSAGILVSGVPAFIVAATASQVNYLQANGSATGNGLQFQAIGSDTNISQVFQSKGTGAIDLAAGSSGVNISNGGTVTAITRTNAGSGYTSVPSVAISAPTTAGGVQATATATVVINGITSIPSGGTGYTVGDVLTVVGGTETVQTTQLTVATVSAGVITSVTVTRFGTYSTAPTNPASVTGGTGSGATFNLNYAIQTTFTITNAGSGYVEQPTVSFSGGGGSGAAAYATVGSVPIVKTIASALSFTTPSSEVFRIVDANSTGQNYISLESSGGGSSFRNAGAGLNLSTYFISKGTGTISFATNASTSTEQLRVSHTASAVNYVQVTGAATGAPSRISAQGSDSLVSLGISAKGAGDIFFQNSGSGSTGFIIRQGSGSIVNYLQATSSATGAAPVFSSQGSDTDIDLTLTPKGAGNVRFGTYTAGILTPTGYITVKDSGGTTRRLLVG